MGEYVLKVLDIDETGKDYDLPVRAAWLAQVLSGTDVRPANDAGDGRLHVRAHRQGVDIVLHGRVSASLAIDCARCLEDAHIDARAELSALLTARGPDVRPAADEVELTPEDLDRDFYSGDEIVLDDMVREHLLLEVPIKPLCADDCPGIDFSRPPENLEADDAPGVDPRLAPLMKLVGQVPSEE